MIRLLSKITLRQKRILLRVDFNVPIIGRRVGDDFRIRKTLPTIQKLLGAGHRLIILAHHSNHAQSLVPVARHLGRLLHQPVTFVPNPFRKAPLVGKARVYFFENLRFWPGEEAVNRTFATALARHGDVFVNDAFGVAHRRAASLTLLPRLLPAYLGLLFENEIRSFDALLKHPKRPVVAIVGGAKIQTKIPILRRFTHFADSILIGGAIANVLFHSRRANSNSKEQSLGPIVAAIARSKKVLLPVDAALRKQKRRVMIPITAIHPGDAVYDIGPQSEKLFAEALRPARTVIWNGPLGVIEERAFARSTLAIARVLATSHAEVHIGGGDTIALLDRVGLANKFHHISTGGGAMLAYLAGEKLPALEALKHSKREA